MKTNLPTYTPTTVFYSFSLFVKSFSGTVDFDAKNIYIYIIKKIIKRVYHYNNIIGPNICHKN